MKSDYYHTKATVEEYINLAKDVNGGALIENLKKFLPAKSTLLELGSGPGTDWKILNADFKAVGSDLSQEFLNHLKTTFPEGNFIELDAISIKTSEIFNGIYSNKVLHHLKDDELSKSVERQAEILKSKGVICHSFWKGEGSEVFKGLFVNYHSKNELRESFDKYFEVLVLEEYAEFEEGDSLLLIGNKK